MGVLCDYFRAADDKAAIALLERLDGEPLVSARRTDPAVDAVDAKGIDPSVTLGQLVAFALDVEWDPAIADGPLVWNGGEDLSEGPWVTLLTETARDALAGITEDRMPSLAARWVRIEELVDDGLPDDALLPVLAELAGLARRARDAGDQLYCWCSL